MLNEMKTEELGVEHEEKGGVKNRWIGGWMDISVQQIIFKLLFCDRYYLR